MAQKKRRTELDIDFIPVDKPETPAEPAESPPPSESSKETAPVVTGPTLKDKLIIFVKKRFLFIIAGIVLLILGVGAIKTVTYLDARAKAQKAEELRKKKEAEERRLAEELKKKEEETQSVPFVEFFAPLAKSAAEPDKEQFVRFAFNAITSTPQATAEIDESMIRYREAVYGFLKGKTGPDFIDEEKRAKTMTELRALLNLSIRSGQITEIEITDVTVY